MIDQSESFFYLTFALEALPFGYSRILIGGLNHVMEKLVRRRTFKVIRLLVVYLLAGCFVLLSYFLDFLRYFAQKDGRCQ